jgi:peptidoglycan/xylan/chitin deacetylase (PgdA/CDA1 family)
MLMRRVAKTAVASAMYGTRADRLFGRMKGDAATPLVLGYHRVVDDFDAQARYSIPAMLTSRAMLERHLDWLGTRYRFISLDELGERMSTGHGFGEPVVALTFDDGYRDVYEHAFPVLRARGIPAAIFVATEFVAQGAPLTHDRLYLLVGLALGNERASALLQSGMGPEPMIVPRGAAARARAAAHITSVILGRLNRVTLDRLVTRLEKELGVSGEITSVAPPLTWQMLTEMHRGGFTIGCHTHTHTVLPTETAADACTEVRRSREVLEHRLGMTVEHFAYPDGRFNVASVQAVRNAGVRFAYTTCGHRDPLQRLLTIPRLLLWEQSCLNVFDRFSPAVMSCVVNRVLDFMNPCVEDHDAIAVDDRNEPTRQGREKAAVATLL